MPPNEREIADDLEERHMADVALDRYGGLRVRMQEWKDELENVYRVYRNEWSMIWPDGTAENSDPSVPNMVRIAADDRARSVAAAPPAIYCYPDGPGDKAKVKSDKLERIATSWFDNAHVRGHKTKMWAYDAMAGLTVCRVMPDFSSPPEMRFPKFDRLSPLLSYPAPLWTPGPFIESFIYVEEMTRREIKRQFGVDVEWPMKRNSENEKLRVLYYYDEEWVVVTVNEVTASSRNQTKRQTIIQEQHRMGHCPVVISASATMDGTYSGEFISGLGVQDYWNKLMTLVMDDAVRKVYAAKLQYNVMNSGDWGPDAELQAETPDARFEFIQNPNQPFSNLQVLNMVQNSTRTSFIMPPSRSGDPNESIISAAGISASAAQFVEDVRSIQRDMLTPMLEAALQVAFAGEEAWDAGVEKPIWSSSKGGYRETYVPSRDIAGYRRPKIRYGPMSGMDEVNQGVMILQQLGAGIIDEQTAMEMSPFVEDVQRVQKRKLQKVLQDSMLAGLAQQAQQGMLDAFTLAMLDQAIQSDEVTLSEAIAALVPQAPLAQPAATSPGAPPEAPGVAGAAEGPQPSNLPPLAELLGG